MTNGDQLYTGDSDPDDHGRQPWIWDAQRSPSPDACGPQAFAKRIRQTPFPARFRAPPNITKYSGDTNPIVWLEDFRLAYRVGGADDDLFIVQYLPLYVVGSARAWLEHLPADSIRSWADLKCIFIGNFLGTYVQPRNAWDLKAYKQKTGETLRKYICYFSKQCNELPDIVDADVIGTFISGTTNEALVHELGRNKPQTMRELLDLATSHAS
jgi:hypothetical protein